MRISFYIWLLSGLLVSVPVALQGQQKNVTTSTTAKTTAPKIEIKVNENRITVNNAPVGGKLEIYSILGVKVKEFKIKASSDEYTVNIDKGYYILKIGETVRKAAIR